MTVLSGGQRWCLLSTRLVPVVLLLLAVLRPAFGQTGPVLVSDTFDRANGSALGTADTGQPWSMHNGSASIQGGTAQLATGFALASLDSGTTQGEVRARVTSLANEFWLIVRLADGANYWRFGRWQNGSYLLQKVQNNALGTPQITTPNTVFPVAGDNILCNLRNTGLECSVNGVVVADTADTFGAAAKRVGFSGNASPAASFDDLVVTGPPLVPNVVVGLNGPLSGYSGAGLSWTATVQNVGSVAAAAAELLIQPPAGHPNLSFGGASCAPESGQYRCSLGSIAPQGSVAVTINLAYVGEVSAVTVTATAPTVIGETDSSDNAASFTTRLRPAMGPDAIAIDTFDLPNGTVLSNANTGQPWTHHFQSVTTQQGEAALTQGLVLTTLDPGSQATGVRVILAQPAAEFWLILRFENQTNYWRFGRWQQQTYQLQQVLNNSLVTSAVIPYASVMPAAGDVLACSTSETSLNCSVNGTTVAGTSSSAGGTASRAGISGNGAAAARFDDFVMTGPPPVPEVSVTLAGPGLVYADSPASWTASVRNNSTVLTAQSLEVLLTPPMAVSQIAIPGFSCVAEGLSWRCSLGNLSPGQTVAVRLDGVTPSSNGIVTFNASVPVQSGEVQTTNNEASVATNVRSPIGPNPLFFDSFNRANAGSLGVATTGQAWTAHAAGFGINNGQATPGSGFALSSVDTGESDLDIEVSVLVPGPEFWLVLRLQDGQTYWRFGRWPGQAYQLQQVTSGALGSPSIQVFQTVMPAPGDVLGCSTHTSGISCSVNGVQVLHTSDQAGKLATRIGLSSYQASMASFDDLVAIGPPPAPNVVVALNGPLSGFSGSGLSWTATVQNAGTVSASGVELHVQPPAGHPNLTFQGATCVAQSGTYRCSLGTLGPQSSVAITVQLASVGSVPSVTLTATAPVVSGEVLTSDNAASLTTQIRPPMAPDAVAVDTFDLPNGTVLTNANTGQPWIHHFQPITIQQGEVALAQGLVLTTMDPGSPPTGVRVILMQPAQEVWLILRFENQANYWRFGRWQQGAYQLQQVQNNSVVTSAVVSYASVMAAPGDVLACSTSETAVTCSVNGTTVAGTSSSVGGTASGVGLSGNGAAAARFDDFVVTGPPPVPNVSVSLVGPGLVYANSPASWTATVRNISTVLAVQSLDVLLTPPAAVSQVAIPGFSCVPQGASWRCPLGNLTPSQTVIVRLDGVTPSAPGILTFAASVPVQANEVQTANNQATVATNVRSAIPANAALFDSFNRPNASSLGVATTGQAWTAHVPGFAINNGQAAPGSGFALSSVDIGESELDITVSVLSPAPEFWLVLRLQDGQTYWRFGRWPGQAYQLQQVVAGSLASPSIQVLQSVMPAHGDVLSCSTNPTGISCFVNGVQVVQTADQGGKLATRVGLSSYQAAGTTFEDLVATAPPPVPNPTVTVSAPGHALAGIAHTVDLIVRNAGKAASGSGVLAVSIPSSTTILSLPSSCSGQGPSLSCAVPALGPLTQQAFTFQLTRSDASTYNGSATLSVSGDTNPNDNQVAWQTSVHPSGSSWVVESFNRPDTTSGLGTAPSQQVWNSLSPGFHIQNGKARADAAGAVAVLDPGYAFGTLDVVLGSDAATTAIVFRVKDANNYYRLGVDQGGFYTVRKIINGVSYPPIFGSTKVFVHPAPGDVVKLITRPDDGLFVAVNGEHVIDHGDPELMFETRWGLASVGGPATVDDFVLNPKIEWKTVTDDFNLANGSTLWRPASGVKYTWMPGYEWVSTAGRARSTSDIYSFTWINTTTELASVEAKVVTQGPGAWLVFRYDEFADTYYRFGQTAGAYVVEFMEGHYLSELPVSVQTLGSPTPQAGDVLRVNQLPNGTVECLVNGVITHRFVDTATNIRWTLYGIAAQGPQPAFDDFKVTP